MSTQGKYMYGIIEESEPRRFGLSGVGDSEVYAINCERIAAVVSDTDLREVDPTRRNVLAHAMVQDRLLREYTLLPMGFGIVANGEREVEVLLQRNYDRLIEELKRLSGKIEAQLKVFWDREAMIKELEGESQEIKTIKARINAASSPVEAYALLVEAGKRIERVAMEWGTKYGQQVYAALRELSVDARLNQPVGVKDILNASFLIDRSREDEFKDAVRELDCRCQGKVNFKYVGPLPPYSFVKLRLESVTG